MILLMLTSALMRFRLTLLAAMVTLVGASVVSMWRVAGCLGTSGGFVLVGNGSVTFGTMGNFGDDEVEYIWHASNGPIDWLPYWADSTGFGVRQRWATVPLWIPGIIAGVLSLASFRAARHLGADRGRCRNCGYNLVGLPHGLPCPECGVAAASQSLSAASPGEF